MMKFLKDVMGEYSPEIKEWDKPTTRVFNGTEVEGRPTKGFGTSSFRYAGKLYEPEPWTDDILIIKWAAEDLLLTAFDKKVDFTFCLCGLYKTGEVAIPHHSDTVPTQKDLVFSVSYGDPRVFEWNEYAYYIKKRTNTSKINILHGEKYLKTTRYIVERGDAFIFDGKSQMSSTHAVPPVFGVGERINLTFRSGL